MSPNMPVTRLWAGAKESQNNTDLTSSRAAGWKARRLIAPLIPYRLIPPFVNFTPDYVAVTYCSRIAARKKVLLFCQRSCSEFFIAEAVYLPSGSGKSLKVPLI